MWRTRIRNALVAVTVLAVPLGGLALLPATATTTAPAARPNIVMIMTDDQTAETLSVMPNVKRLLGSQGTTFPNMFTSYPLCCPSRATYLTGQYGHNHKVLDNKAPYGGYQKLRGGNTLPVWLARSGYSTVHIGKYLNGYGKDPREVPPGWTEWHGLVDAYRMYGYRINHTGTVKRYGEWDSEEPKYYQTDVLRRLAVDYVDRKAPADKPFFLSLAPLAPHVEVGDEIRKKYGAYSPRPAPRHKGTFKDRKLPRPPSFNEPNVSDKPRHIRNLDRMSDADIRRTTTRYRAQLESLLAVDEMVGAVVKKLEAKGELANTTIMFTGDNGYLSGEHRIGEGKVHPYEPSIRVPMLVRGPGFPKGRTVTQAVSNVDWAPTIVRAAGATAGLTMDGRPLQALVKDPSSGERRQLLFETGPKGDQRWYAAVRGARYKYIRHSTGEVELYDRKKDPHELASRHADPAYRDVRARLDKRLKELRGCSGRACWGLTLARSGDGASGGEQEPPPAGESPEPTDGSPTPAGSTAGADAGAGAGGGGGGGGGGQDEAAGPAGVNSKTSLPVTGLAIGGLLALGAGAVGAGFALRAAVRRRRADTG